MSELTTKQKKGVAALLAEPTHEAAAEAVGVTSRTLRRWLHNPDFRMALAEAEAEAVAAAARSMAAGAAEAVNCLRDVLSDPEADPRVKVVAAVGYLNQLPKVRLLGSIEAQIQELQGLNNANT